MEKSMNDFLENANNENTNRFLRLLMKNERRVYAYILSMVANSNDADDILQESTIVMWRKFGNFQEDMDFTCWAMTIARYQVLSFYKKNKNRKVVFSSSLLEIIESEFTKLESPDARISMLKSCMKGLTSPDVELMRLRYEENLTLKTIGERVMKSTRATHYAIARIHNLLLLCVRRKMANE